jgi:hypothetical protein
MLSRFSVRTVVLVAVLLGVVVGVAAALAAGAARRPAAAPATVTVTPPAPAPVNTALVQLLGSTSSTDANINMTHDNRCFGRGPYAYLDAEAPVTIADPASGRVLATSKLSQGTLYDGVCQFTFTVPTLPSMSQYSVRVDGQLPTVVSQVRMQQGLILRTGTCCAVPSSDPGALS